MMKRIVFLAFVVVLAVSASGAFAVIQDLGTYADPAGSGITIEIQRASVTDGAYIWQWSFTVANPQGNAADALEQFTAGFSPSYYDNATTNYYTGFAGPGTESELTNTGGFATSATWQNINLQPGQSETWSYLTSLPSQSLGAYNLHDGNWAATLLNLPVPGVVPEPMSLLLGCLGLTSIAGFRRIRK